MNMHGITREQSRQLERDRAKWPAAMTEIPADQWPPATRFHPRGPLKVWRSRDFLAQLFEDGITLRLSIQRTAPRSDNQWVDDISWDDLQRVKNECGFDGHWMVELYPPVADVVNVANIRHLWVGLEPPPFGWHRAKASA